MAENKTETTDVNPIAFIDAVKNETKRKDSHDLVALMKKGCPYISKLDDVDRNVLRELVTISVAEMRTRYASAAPVRHR